MIVHSILTDISQLILGKGSRGGAVVQLLAYQRSPIFRDVLHPVERDIRYNWTYYMDILYIYTRTRYTWTCYTWYFKRITEFLPVGMFKASKGCRTNRVWDASPKVLRVYWDLPHGVGLAGGVIVLKVVGIDCIAIKGYSGHSRCLINECLFKKKNFFF